MLQDILEDATILEDRLSKVADVINWARMPELEEFEAMAGRVMISGYYGTEELMDTSASGRTQLYKISADVTSGRACLVRKLLNPGALPAETE